MTIAEVGKKYDITPDTLRYYERIGLIPKVGRTSGGIRDYNEMDCRWVEFAKCMRSSGLPVEALIEYISLYQQGDDTVEARKSILVEQHKLLAEKINEMQNTLDRLDVKIGHYEEYIVHIENALKRNN